MESPISISIIIPVFNDAIGLARTLDGISRQSWPADTIEVIVVDNGSDELVSVQRAYAFSLHVVRCEKPGSYAARNTGAMVAKGDVFAFTDADCMPCEHWLQRGMEALRSGQGKWAVGGDVVFTPIKSPTSVALYQISTGFGQESNIKDKGFSATANLFCTKDQFETVGPFDERLLSGGDREWAWRASKHNIMLKYQPEAIVYTEPRSSLRGAIRQARRVVAGRTGLRNLGLAHQGKTAISKQRTVWQSVRWILSNEQLGIWDKLRVLAVAALIRGAAGFESVRLALGANAERR